MGEDATRGTEALAASRVLTIPNLLSFARIALIPVFVWLIVDRDTTFSGLILFGVVVAIGAIAWGSLGYAFEAAFLACGWTFFAIGILEYYVATALYVGDLRRALASGS